jgi:Mg-chelatase subunit ChlD
MVTTGGGGTDAPLAIATLRRANAQPTRPNTQTLLILLTDGEWGDAKMVTTELQALLSEGCDMAVFTIGCDATEAKSFVGDDRADEITDDTAGEVITEHIARLIDPIV